MLTRTFKPARRGRKGVLHVSDHQAEDPTGSEPTSKRQSPSRSRTSARRGASGPRTVLRRARLASADGLSEPTDVYVRGGLVEGFDLGGAVDLELDAREQLVTPAFIDLHAHLRDPGQEVKEDLASGLAAAAAGGFGTVVSMANTTPPVDDPGLVTDLVRRAELIGQARLRPAATVSVGMRGERLTDFAALKAAGAVMLTDDGIPIADAHLMRRACEYAAELGLVIQTHSEEPHLRADGVMNEGRVSRELGLPGNTASAEAVMVFRDTEIARLTGARVHIAHVSCERAMRVAEWQRANGAPITIEVTPQHLTLTDESLRAFDPVFKVAPPLRTAADVAHLKEALRRGAVDNIGTDHAPHTLAEKERDLLEAPFGIANLEVTFALLYTRLVLTGELPLAALLRLLQGGPASVMGWQAPTLTPGAAADLTVIDLESELPVQGRSFKSKAKHNPWEGERLRGWPRLTLVRGNVCYDREAGDR
ncbi:MAG: dihydroorotase [Trueperaceae bacterium]|nr:dihydroorotase [Trueperaceae bacterium]MCW5819491.1 dihydroorotase [Trueperaceae bacterium]